MDSIIGLPPLTQIYEKLEPQDQRSFSLVNQAFYTESRLHQRESTFQKKVEHIYPTHREKGIFFFLFFWVLFLLTLFRSKPTTDSLLDEAPYVQNLRLNRRNLGDPFYTFVKTHLTSLTRLEIIRCSPLSLQAMEQITHIPTLRKFKCDHSGLTDSHLLLCQNMHSLASLSLLRNNDLTDQGVSYLLDLPLSELALVSLEKLTDRAASSIQRMKGLRRLNMSFCDGLTDRFIEAISTLFVESLDISGIEKITGKGLRYIGSMQQIRSLEISYLRCDSHSYSYLTNLHSLETLHANGCEVQNEGFAHIAKITSLRKIHLDNHRLGGTILKKLKHLPELEELSLGITYCRLYHYLTRRPFNEAPCIEGLRTLDVRGLVALKDSDILMIVKKFPNVTALNLRDCFDITHIGLKTLKGLAALQRVEVSIGRNYMLTYENVESFKKENPHIDCKFHVD